VQAADPKPGFDSLLGVAVLNGMSSCGVLPDDGGAHGAPAENPFGDEQLGVSWIAIRYAPGRHVEQRNEIEAPSPRSITRIFPDMAEPPIARSTACCDASVRVASGGAESG
jgi:hypothetical protein